VEESIEARKNRAWREVAAIDRDLTEGRIDEDGWFAAMQALITPAYLAGTNPRAQSGHSGDERRWREARSLVSDAFDRDGSFLDIGCASGHLMETARGWAAERGITIEPYGLDISPELVALARLRLPQWRDRIWEGNALRWRPPRRFTYIRTSLEYVPARRRGELVRHLLEAATDHRLLIGPATEERDVREIEETLRDAGYKPTGRIERPHGDPRLLRRLVWISR
jgi:SAM-dependent methyltransferase